MTTEPAHDLVDGWLGDSMYDVQWRPGLDPAGAHDRSVDPEDPAAVAAARHFRDVLGRFTSGVTVVTGLDSETPVGLTCQSFSSVSLNPPLVLFVPSTASRAWPLIQRSGRFAVNVLSEDQRDVSDRMAGRSGDKFAGVGWSPSPVTGSPLLDGTICWIDCTVESVHPDVVVGRVVDLGLGAVDRPLLFSAGAYRRLDGPGEP